jgi:uroporphyrinogen decarboxylase
MTPRDRILTALDREEPDRVPVCEFTINSQIREHLCGSCSYDDMVEELELDAAVVLPSKSALRKTGDDTYRDAWGTEYRDTGENALIEVGFPIQSPKDLIDYRPPDPLDDLRLETLEGVARRFKGQRAIVFTISDSFSGPRKLMGMENILSGYITDPSFIEEVIDMCVGYNIGLLQAACSRGAEIIFSGDDYAGTFGPLMSPAHFERFVAPGLRRIVDKTHESGARYVKHTDGNLMPIIDTLVGTGIDGLHPIDPNAGMNIFEMKETYGDRICIFGNVDCEYTLCEGSESEVEEEVKKLIAGLAPGGGYVIASSNSIHNGVKPRNFLAMIRATRKNGTYPIKSAR